MTIMSRENFVPHRDVRNISDRSTQPSNRTSKGGELKVVNIASQETVLAIPLEVRVFNNFDKAMRAFRSLVQKERVLSLYKERSFYEKPSDKKRRKKNEAKRKILELSFDKEKVPSRNNDAYLG